eukprot:356735-Chlamydomonas_euryale.AAC.12
MQPQSFGSIDFALLLPLPCVPRLLHKTPAEWKLSCTWGCWHLLAPAARPRCGRVGGDAGAERADAWACSVWTACVWTCGRHNETCGTPQWRQAARTPETRARLCDASAPFICVNAPPLTRRGCAAAPTATGGAHMCCPDANPACCQSGAIQSSLALHATGRLLMLRLIPRF